MKKIQIIKKEVLKMINAKLKKQLSFYNSKCWAYHNKIKHTFGNLLKITKLEEQSKKYHVKYYEIQLKLLNLIKIIKYGQWKEDGYK